MPSASPAFKAARKLPQFINAYKGRQLDRVALPVGGIGTGTLSVGGRGQLTDWEIVNHTAKGFVPRNAFFAVSTRQAGKPLDCRLLEGALPETVYEGEAGCAVQLPGVPRFGRAECRTVYPFIEVALADPASPLEAKLLAYNPFIPCDIEGSSWPVAVFEIKLTNRTKAKLDASIALGCANFVGTDGTDTLPSEKRNRARSSRGLGAILMDSQRLPAHSELRGDFCVAVDRRSGGRFASSTGLGVSGWNNEVRALFERFAKRGDLPTGEKGGAFLGAVALHRVLPPGKSAVWRFYIAWRFPNRLAWALNNGQPRARIGNYYRRLGSNSWEILRKFEAKLPELREQTVRFTEAFGGSDIPETIKEAALANLPALRSQTLFRTPDGRFLGYEGGHRNKRAGGTLGSCTHVWGYDLASSFLFPGLARSFRELQFGPSQHEDGAIAFRTSLPIAEPLRHPKVAADGQLASVIGFYRDWMNSGDRRWARRLWPRVKKAIEFCWREGSWDADRDGVMEGCQHNTMDVDYYGPNPLMQGLYVTALRCAAELAGEFGDEEFQKSCGEMAEAGSRYLGQKLFNGEYFIQRVPRDIRGLKVDPRLLCKKGDRNGQPHYQVGTGVLIDQLLGGLHARVCGLEEPVSAAQTRKALAAVVRHNYRDHVGADLNHMRGFAVGDEPGTLMGTWPQGGKPELPFTYYCEVMTGFEHALGAHLLYHGEEAKALKVISAVRSRHTGNQRNPFNEAEWGNHYARALASWGSVWAWTGQHYFAKSGALSFRNPGKRVVWPWFAGGAWGTIEIVPRVAGCSAVLNVAHGRLALRALRIGEFSIETTGARIVTATKALRLKAAR